MYTIIVYCIQHGAPLETEVLSIRVKRSLKKEADRLGIDVKGKLEALLEELIAEKKQKAQERANELSQLMAVSDKEWADEVRKTRTER